MAIASLARRRRSEALAAVAMAAVAASGSAAERPVDGPAATEYEQIRAQLGEDVAALREIQSIEAKIARKRELLPAYQPWCQGVLAAASAEGGVGCQDDVVAQVMVWEIDVGNFAFGLDLADYVLKWGVALPERFERTPACLVLEEIADAAIAAQGQDQPFDLGILLRVEELTAAHDMPDQVRAKICKAIGVEMARVADAIGAGAEAPAGAHRAALEGAIAKLRRALELNAKAGVKKIIERLDRELKKLVPAPEQGS